MTRKATKNPSFRGFCGLPELGCRVNAHYIEHVPLDEAGNTLSCIFIYMLRRTDLTPEEIAAIKSAAAAADVVSDMIFDRVVRPRVEDRDRNKKVQHD